MHVVLFRDVKYSDDKIMWFVLYPFLMQKMARRKVLSGSTNWSILKDKFKTRSLMSLNLFKTSEKRVQDALGNTRTLDTMQDHARKDLIDVFFARIVRSGRRFAS
jgi:hypothetical protein